MAVIQLVIDEELLGRLDQELRGTSKARSAFIRKAIEAALNRDRTTRLEEEQRCAYTTSPESPAERVEHDSCEKSQDWGEGWRAGTR